METFAQLGIAQKAIQEGNIDNTVRLLVRNREAAAFRFKEILQGESAYPYFLILAQDKTEKLLLESLEAAGQKVLWEHDLVYFKEEEEEGISARIKEPSGEEKVLKVRYLLGCDGASSFVRGQAGIPFEGKTYSPTFYLADGELEWEQPHGGIYFSLAPGYLSGIFSFAEKNKYRVFNFLNTRTNKQEGELGRKDFQEILDPNPYLRQELKNPEWFSIFKIHSRLTRHFGKGRVFLVGDAAHVHSPAGVQGMNTGIQDTYNLAWKLALVIKGAAVPSLLNSYHEERYVIARNLHRTTDRFFHLMISRNKAADFFRLHLFPRAFKFVTGNKGLRERALRRVFQLAIKYPFSSLSWEAGTKRFSLRAPRSGSRAPYAKINQQGKETDVHQLLKCTHFTLLIGVFHPEDARALKLAAYFSTYKRLPFGVHILAKASGGNGFHDGYGIKKEAMFCFVPTVILATELQGWIRQGWGST